MMLHTLPLIGSEMKSKGECDGGDSQMNGSKSSTIEDFVETGMTTLEGAGVTGLFRRLAIFTGSSVKMPRKGEETTELRDAWPTFDLRSLEGSGSQQSHIEFISPQVAKPTAVFKFQIN